MANLVGSDIGLNYKGILNLGATVNQNISGSLQYLTDGDGNNLLIQVSTGAIRFGGATGLNWDDANNRLGIGTASPSAKLDVSGSILITTGSLGVGTTGSAIVGRIDASNDVVAYSTSDIRLKKNIQLIPNALDKIDKINGYTFNWKKDKKLTDIHGFAGHDVGVIAQEIEEILPEIVTIRDNGYKAVKYEKIIPLLIQCIKELKSEINELKSKTQN